jgi:hypothetical protein
MFDIDHLVVKRVTTSSIGARGRNRTGTTFLSRQILNLLCLPISPLGLAGAIKLRYINQDRQILARVSPASMRTNYLIVTEPPTYKATKLGE